eukprot:TRINITY_DN121245_c0_g1_i1.p1 TRINITY_DN121245_c0_g1~~TRINITY_DN121245_c0_g1_i1.p1  ORF type:complete len:553 (+),score=70.41 TRINITY_DN121245_c0_g1_i1:72-1730(+)
MQRRLLSSGCAHTLRQSKRLPLRVIQLDALRVSELSNWRLLGRRLPQSHAAAMSPAFAQTRLLATEWRPDAQQRERDDPVSASRLGMRVVESHKRTMQEDSDGSAAGSAQSAFGREAGSDMSKADAQEAAALRVTWIGFGANILLSLLKGIAGKMSGSAAMVADAVHSVSDTISDVVTLWAVKVSRKPADDKHPYGYGRSEPLGSLVVSATVTMAGLGIGHHSFQALQATMGAGIDLALVMSNAPLALAAALASCVVKEALFHVTIKVGKEVHSSVLVANAWHHRSDALSSVVAAVGILGHWADVPVLDPIAGGVVAMMVTRMGLTMAADAMRELMDAQVDEETLDVIRKAAVNASSDILNVHDLRCRGVGPTLMVDLHATVRSRLSVSAANQAGGLLRRAVMQAEPRVAEVMVHMDPFVGDSQGGDLEITHIDLAFPAEGPATDASDEEVRSIIAGIIRSDYPEIKAVTSMVCHFCQDGRLSVELAIKTPELMTLAANRALADRLRSDIRRRMTRQCIGCRCIDVAAVDVRLELLENEWQHSSISDLHVPE